MDGLAAYQDLEDVQAELFAEVGKMEQAGVQLARNEAEYRKELAKEMLRRRADGMAVSMLSDVCRGDARIAGLKLQRDCSDAIYSASKERINVLKLRLRILQAQMKREWSDIPR